ncbi:MAG: peptidoglycan binding domain-containing protein [Anaerolineales bacterium]|nr:peptidoglycan binding domain-containing protein [Anaerolineales bacterium]
MKRTIRRLAHIIRRFTLLVLLGIAAFGSAPVLLTLGSYCYFQLTDEMLPGIVVGGIPVGGLQPGEAARDLHKIWNEDLQLQAVDITSPSHSWEVAPSEFGLRVAATESIAKAHALGRSRNIIEAVRTMLEVLRYGAEIDPLVKLDIVIAKEGLERWAEQVDVAPRDANLKFDGDRLVQIKSMSGRTLDIVASLRMLAEEPESILLDHQLIPFVTLEIPAQRQDVSGPAEVVQNLLDSSPTLRAYDPVTGERFVWSPEPVLIASWIRLESEGSQLLVYLDDDLIIAYVIEIEESLGEARGLDTEVVEETLRSGLMGEETETLVVEYLPGTYVVEPDDNLISISFKVGFPYWKLQEFNPDLASTGPVPGETLIVPPLDDMFTLPVIQGKRIVISLIEQRMWTYLEDELQQSYIVSTGIPNSPTLPGLFQVTSHIENAYAAIWDLYMPHFLGIYEAVPGFTNGIHGLPLLSGGRRLWADVLGQPAAYGCIILTLQAAEDL